MASERRGIQSVRMQNVATFLWPLREFFVARHDNLASETLRTAMQEPKLIHVMNHGPMAAPYIAGAVVAEEIVRAGGGERIPLAIFHRRMMRYQFFRDYFQQHFGATPPLRFEEIVSQFGTGPFSDFVVLPEGANELYGDMRWMRPFKSHRYLELAILLDAPLLLTVHRGTENWSTALRLDDGSLTTLGMLSPAITRRILPTRTLNLPGLPMPIPQLLVTHQLYWPRLQGSELAATGAERYRQIRQESQLVRQQMNALLAQLDEHLRRSEDAYSNRPLPAPAEVPPRAPVEER